MPPRRHPRSWLADRLRAGAGAVHRLAARVEPTGVEFARVEPAGVASAGAEPAGVASRPPEVPRRFGQPPQHWLDLVTAHAPGLLHDVDLDRSPDLGAAPPPVPGVDARGDTGPHDDRLARFGAGATASPPHGGPGLPAGPPGAGPWSLVDGGGPPTAGPTAATGPSGATGASGASGASGMTGPSGTSGVSGSRAPGGGAAFDAGGAPGPACGDRWLSAVAARPSRPGANGRPTPGTANGSARTGVTGGQGTAGGSTETDAASEPGAAGEFGTAGDPPTGAFGTGGFTESVRSRAAERTPPAGHSGALGTDHCVESSPPLSIDRGLSTSRPERRPGAGARAGGHEVGSAGPTGSRDTSGTSDAHGTLSSHTDQQATARPTSLHPRTRPFGIVRDVGPSEGGSLGKSPVASGRAAATGGGNGRGYATGPEPRGGTWPVGPEFAPGASAVDPWPALPDDEPLWTTSAPPSDAARLARLDREQAGD